MGWMERTQGVVACIASSSGESVYALSSPVGFTYTYNGVSLCKLRGLIVGGGREGGGASFTRALIFGYTLAFLLYLFLLVYRLKSTHPLISYLTSYLTYLVIIY